MNGIVAIMKKEWRCFFLSPVAYMVIGVFLLIMGIIFSFFVDYYNYNQARVAMGQAAEMSIDKIVASVFENISFVITFMSPMLTMKLFAEERRQQTFELLFTSPIRGYELVIGKFLASFGLLLVMLALSFVYVIFMIMWGTPDMAVIGTTYLGLSLILGCYLAIGGLVSAFSSNQAVAAMVNFVLLLFLFIVQVLGQNVKAKFGSVDWSAVIVYMSPLFHFRSFTEGVVQLKDVVYYLTFIGVMLYFTQKVIESQRWR